MDKTKDIVEAVLRVYPHTQAIYLFGSYGTETEWPDSDVDMALLLPPVAAKEAGSLLLSELHLALQSPPRPLCRRSVAESRHYHRLCQLSNVQSRIRLSDSWPAYCHVSDHQSR
jgi:hypothetical protein